MAFDISYLYTAFTYATIIGLVGVGVLIYRSTVSKNKKDKKRTLAWVGVLMLAFAMIPAFGYLDGLKGTINLGGTPTMSVVPATTGGVITGCAVEDTTVKLSGVDKYNSTAVGGTHAYKINNGAKATVSDVGTFTASPGDSLQVLWEQGSTSTIYFGEVDTYTIPCKGTYDLSRDLVHNGTLTMNVFNEEGELIQLDGTTYYNETMANGDVANLKIDVRGTNEAGYPHGGVFVIELNGTEYDEEKTTLSFTDLSVKKLSSVPQVHTLSSTDNKAIAFEVQGFEGANLHSGTLTLDADSSNDPASTSTNPTITFRPYNYFINEDTGASFDGPAVEDEDNSATFTHDTVVTVYVD